MYAYDSLSVSSMEKRTGKKKKKKLDIFCCISACKDSKAKQTV